MPTLYIRDVSDDVAATLKERAASEGMSLSAYVAAEVVIDASAMVEALIGREVVDELLDALTTGDVYAPHLLDIEVLSVMRGLLLGGKLDPAVAEEARRDHFAFAINRYEVAPLAERIWQLRHQYTSHDAAYLALAEALDAPLHTCDSRLGAGGHHAKVHVLHRTH